MPSTVVHVALAGLLGTALLADEFDGRAIAVVMAVAIVPDLDVFLGFWLPGAHRAAFHTLLLPLAVTVLALAYDRSSKGALRDRLGPRGVRIAWVSLVAFVVAGILPDLFLNGVNLFYPVHDQFYDLNGRVFISNQRGFVQTMIDLSKKSPKPRTTRNTHFSTGVDPTEGAEKRNVERIFPIAWTGIRFLFVLIGYSVVAFRVWESRKR